MTSHSCGRSGEKRGSNEVRVKLCACACMCRCILHVYISLMLVCACARVQGVASGEMMGWFSWFFKQPQNSTTRWCVIARSEEAIIRVLLYHSDRALFWRRPQCSNICGNCENNGGEKNMLLTTSAVLFAFSFFSFSFSFFNAFVTLSECLKVW